MLAVAPLGVLQNKNFSNIETVYNGYDGFNRLVKVENVKSGQKVISEFIYTGDNLRVRKTVKRSSTGYASEVLELILVLIRIRVLFSIL